MIDEDPLGPANGIANGIGLTFIVAAAIFGSWYLAKILIGGN